MTYKIKSKKVKEKSESYEVKDEKINGWKQYTNNNKRKQWIKNDMIIAILQIDNKGTIQFVKSYTNSEDEQKGFVKTMPNMETALKRVKQYMRTH